MSVSAITESLLNSGHSCTEDGFGLAEEAVKAAKRFFALSLQERLQLSCREGAKGYSMDSREFAIALNSGLVKPSDQASLVHERDRGYCSFDFGHEDEEKVADYGLIYARNVMPSSPALAHDCLSLFDRIREWSNSIAKEILDYINVDAKILDSNYCSMRFLRYAGEPSGIRASKEHADFELFTLIASDCAGLETTVDGRWHAIEWCSTSWIILPGETLESLSNGSIPASQHRVSVGDTPRYSVPFFQGVGPETLVNGVDFAQHLRDHFTKSYPHLRQ
jgi:isopenicillin N synthase-like dioxygenase